MCWLLFQVPAGNNGQAAARHHPLDNLAPADPQEAENLGDEAGLDDEDVDDDEEEDKEEEVRVEDGNHGGQGGRQSHRRTESIFDLWKLCLTAASLGFVEDLNWNALEWDRAAEELTWERVGILFMDV